MYVCIHWLVNASFKNLMDWHTCLLVFHWLTRIHGFVKFGILEIHHDTIRVGIMDPKDQVGKPSPDGNRLDKMAKENGLC